MLRKKIWGNFQRIIEPSTQQIFTKLSKIWVWDPGSGITYSGSRGQKDPGSESATLTSIMHLQYVLPADVQIVRETYCSTTGKPTRSFATERVSLDSV